MNDQGFGVGPVINPDPGLTINHLKNTALVPARPASRLIHQHNAGRRPGPEIVVAQMQARQGRRLAINAAAERPRPGLKAGRLRFRLGLNNALPLKLLDRGVNCRRQATLDVGAEQAGSPTGLIEPPPLTGHAHPGTGVSLTQTTLPTQGGKGFAQATGGRIKFETRH